MLSTVPALPVAPTLPDWIAAKAAEMPIARSRSRATASRGAASPVPRSGRDRSRSRPLRHRARDRIVQTPVQRAKVFGGDVRSTFDGKLGDRLADVAVVVHDFGHGIPLQEHVVPVLRRGRADREVRRRSVSQLVEQLIEEHRDAAIDLDAGVGRIGPFCHLRAASRGDIGVIGDDELIEHRIAS